MKRILGILAVTLGLACALFPLQAQQGGGAFVPSFGYDISGLWNFQSAPTVTSGGTLVSTAATQTLTNKTLTSAALTTPVVDGVTYSALNDRQVVVEAFSVAGAALHAANLTGVTFPADAVILRAWLDITTVCTGACTIDVGYTATTATTSSDTLLDGVDGNTAVAVFDSMNAALDSGANAKAQKAASGKWVTLDEASGDTTGMVAILYVMWVRA